MERIDAQAVKKGLTVFITEGRTFIGLVDSITGNKDGYTLVRDAIELRFHMVEQGGQQGIRVMPQPILPADSPLKEILIPRCPRFDASRDSELIKTYDLVTGKRSVLIPGMSMGR